jgi:hypothetical protein
MSLLSLDHVRHGRLITVSTERLVTAAVTLAANGLAIIALLAAAPPETPRWPVAPLLALALITVAAPDSPLGLSGVVAYAAWWLAVTPDTTSVWALVAGLALLVGHASSAYAAAGPASLHADPAVRLAWLRDTTLVASATVGVWLLARVAGSAPAAGEIAVGATLLLLGAAITALRNRPENHSETGDQAPAR